MYIDYDESKSSCLSYISVKVLNIPGVLNRISHLMRRRKYNMEDVNINYGNDDFVYIEFAVDANIHDIEQVVSQINKIQYVEEVSIVDHVDNIFLLFCVYQENQQILDFYNEQYKNQPTVMESIDSKVFIFSIKEKDKSLFVNLLEKQNIPYKKNVLTFGHKVIY